MTGIHLNADAWIVLAVLLLLVVRLIRGRKPAPAVVAAPSRLLPVLAAAAAVMGVSWWEATHPAPKVITAPAPRPVVTVTAPPHVTVPVHQLFTGGDIVAIYVIAAIVAVSIILAVLRRSS